MDSFSFLLLGVVFRHKDLHKNARPTGKPDARSALTFSDLGSASVCHHCIAAIDDGIVDRWREHWAQASITSGSSGLNRAGAPAIQLRIESAGLIEGPTDRSSAKPPSIRIGG
jgi:hypothetical protein